MAPPQPMCWRYQSLTAAIAAVTIDCQGTIGPGSFKLDAKGNLVPTFTSCIAGASQAKAATQLLVPAAPVAASPAAAAAPPKLVAQAATPPGVTPPSTTPSAAPAATAPAATAPASAAAQAAVTDYELLTQLLSFQDIATLPNIRECIGGRWTRWSELFKRTQITTCPTWQKTEVVGAPQIVTDANGNRVDLTTQQMGKMQPRLPVAPDSCNEYKTPEERKKCVLSAVSEQLQRDPALRNEQKLAEVLLPPKTSALYTVTLPSNTECKDTAVCAAQCAAAFPGFVLAASGNRVDGDATYWLNADLPGTYAGYQHPMAQYNGPPGDVFGHINRAGEECWRWDDFDGLYITRLRNANIPGVSICGDF